MHACVRVCVHVCVCACGWVLAPDLPIIEKGLALAPAKYLPIIPREGIWPRKWVGPQAKKRMTIRVDNFVGMELKC